MSRNRIPDDVKAVRVTYHLTAKSGITTTIVETFPKEGFIPEVPDIRVRLFDTIRSLSLRDWFGPVAYAKAEVEYLR